MHLVVVDKFVTGELKDIKIEQGFANYSKTIHHVQVHIILGIDFAGIH